MFKRVLIANRGEIAVRICRTCKRLGIHTISVYSSADSQAQHRYAADESIWIGEAESQKSYLNLKAILAAALESKAEAIHPGYGFLAENADFARQVIMAGMTFIGPSPEAINLLGDKLKAKEIGAELKVPIAPSVRLEGQDISKQVKEAALFAEKVGYPVLIKAAGGGGGRGMRRVESASDIESALLSASREAQSFFGDNRVFIEKLVYPARHIEVQILGDSHGNVMHLFDRDCSFQRHNQKVIEEAPAPNLPQKVRDGMYRAAIALGKRARYSGAGTVEFLYDGKKDFYFLEVNSRLQVEHPVTEMISGLDLVEMQLRVASGESLKEIPELTRVSCNGSAIEARVCAEDPHAGFVASTGTLRQFSFPEVFAPAVRIRVDSGFRCGDTVTHYYDSMLAKVISWGESREASRQALLLSLQSSMLFGVSNNVSFLVSLLCSEPFVNVEHHVTLASHLLCDAKSWKQRVERLGMRAAVLKVLMSIERQALPVKTLSGFRIHGLPKFLFALEASQERFVVELLMKSASEFDATCEGLTTALCIESAAFRADGVFEANLIAHGVRERICCMQVDESLWLSHDGEFLEFSESPIELKIKSVGGHAQGHSDVVLSPLPGKVIAIKGVSGQTVQAGDVLMVIESMKMEHPIKAPHSGVIAEYLVKSGEVIPCAAKLCKLSQV